MSIHDLTTFHGGGRHARHPLDTLTAAASAGATSPARVGRYARARVRTALSAIVLTGLALAAPLAAQAPGDTIPIDELVVTATRLATSRAATSASVSVISGEELRARGQSHLLDALRSLPGLSVVQNGSFGATASLFLRGGQSDYVQVLVDGVPFNEPGGRADLSNLTTDNIERIEIVRGPASVLYGSDAVSGVIQIFTRGGRNAPRVSAGVRGGSYGSLGYNADLTGASNGANYSFAASRFTTDGIHDFGNQYRNTTLSGKVRLAPDARTDLTLSLRYSDGKYHYPTDGAGNIIPGQNAVQLEERVLLGLEIGRFLTDRIESRLLLTNGKTTGGTDDRTYDTDDNLTSSYRAQDDLRRQGIDARTNFYLARGTILTAGIAFEDQRQRSANESTSEWGESYGSFDAARKNRAYYLQALAEPIAKLSLQAGARLDDNDAFGNFTTYRAGLAYGLPTGTRIRASAGTAFKEPTFTQNYATGYVTGNPDLHPEESRSWEAGLYQTFFNGQLTLAGTYFDQRFREMIQYRGTPPTPTESNYYNIARADAAGIELELRAEPLAGLALSAGYTHLDTRVRQPGDEPDPGFLEGERLIRRPTHAGNLGIAYSRANLGTIDLAINYTGERDDLDFNNWPADRITLDAYTRVDLGADIILLRAAGRRPELNGTLRIENIFDEKFQEIAGFPARGRALTIGLRTGLGL
jgi:vitamin B12 transporter